MSQINISGFEYVQADDGNWICKAESIGPFKKNGNLKKKYKDLPRFKAIVQYENREVNDFDSSLKSAIKDISFKLLSFSSETNHV